MKSKVFGSIFIVAGTTIGAGMLALPLTSFSLGFIPSCILILFLWALMLHTANLTLTAALRFPLGSSFHTMAESVLGPRGKWLVSCSLLLLFYALLSAYTSGVTSFLSHFTNLPIPLLTSGTILLLGGVVVWRTAIMDQTNRTFFFFKIICFLCLIYYLTPHIQLIHLKAVPAIDFQAWWLAIPVFFTSFGFHGSIPSLISYLGKDARRLRFVFIVGSAIPFMVYLLWQGMTLGILPRTGPISFAHIVVAGKPDVGAFVAEMNRIIALPQLGMLVNFFSVLAIVTSFLGVALGLFDFFRDFLPVKKWRRGHAAVFTFVPPLIIVLYAPQIFVQALGFAAIALVVLAVLLPVLLTWQHDDQQKSFVQKISLLFLGLIGICIIGIECYALLK